MIRIQRKTLYTKKPTVFLLAHRSYSKILDREEVIGNQEEIDMICWLRLLVWFGSSCKPLSAMI